MSATPNVTALTVFVLLFGIVALMGFLAARWRQGSGPALAEWGLGGRRFGTVITWFLLGGDLYTAYTFIAVPALMFGAGPIGFFAVPYTILIYPMLLSGLPAAVVGCAPARLCHRRRFRARPFRQPLAGAGRRGHRPGRDDALYRAAAGRHAGGASAPWASGDGLLGDLPLIIAFVVLAAFTYTYGLRAPAMIARGQGHADLCHGDRGRHRDPAMNLADSRKIFAAVPPAKLLLAPPAADSSAASRLCHAGARLRSWRCSCIPIP